MANLVSPGVQTTQVRNGPTAPPNIATAIAGMLCYTQWGPVGVPMKVTGTPNAATIFGNRITSPGNGRMTDALIDYYNSGGSTTYIMRYIGESSAAGTSTLDTVGGSTSGTLSSSSGAFPAGMAAGATFLGKVDGGGATTLTIEATPATITGSGATYDAVTASHTLVVSVVGVAGNQTITFAGTESTQALFMAAINAQLREARAINSAGQVKIETDREGSTAAGSIVSGSSDVLTSLGLSVASFTNAGPNNVANVDAVTGAEFAGLATSAYTGSTTVANSDGSVTWTSSSSGSSSSVQFSSGTGVAYVAGFDNAVHSGSGAGAIGTATLSASLGKYASPGSYINLWSRQVTQVNTTVTTCTATPAGSTSSLTLTSTRRLAIGDQISITKSSDTERGIIALINGSIVTFVAPITVPSGGYSTAQSVVLETWNLSIFNDSGNIVAPSPFTNLRMSPLSGNYFQSVINSAFLTPVNATDLMPDVAGGDDRPVTDSAPVLFSGGSDGSAPTASDVIETIPNWDLAADLNFFCTPGCVTDFGNTLGASILLEEEAYADNRADVMAIMGMAQGTGYTDAVTFVQVTANLASSYEAMYWPWVLRLDVVTNAILPFPPEPFVLGEIARTQQNRNYGKAPAGAVDGNLPTAQGTEFPIVLQGVEYNTLYPALINAIIPLPGYGTCVFGSRTLDPTGEYGQINIQVIFNVSKRSINLVTLPYVFEGCNAITWNAITQVATSFFRQQWKAGILQGTTEADAFFVICDATNNTPDIVDQDTIVGRFGIAPQRPGEFLEFTLELVS